MDGRNHHVVMIIAHVVHGPRDQKRDCRGPVKGGPGVTRTGEAGPRYAGRRGQGTGGAVADRNGQMVVGHVTNLVLGRGLAALRSEQRSRITDGRAVYARGIKKSTGANVADCDGPQWFATVT